MLHLHVVTRSFFILLVAVSALFGVRAQDAQKSEKSAEPGKPVRYEPLVVPEGAKGTASSVPRTGKDPVSDSLIHGKFSSEPPDASGSAGPSGTLLPPGALGGDKKNKEQLWIYTLPQEQEDSRKKAEARELRAEEWEQYQRARQLPEWAVDPEFRKYFSSPPPGEPAASPGLPSAFRRDDWFSGGRSAWDAPDASRAAEPAGSLWSGPSAPGPVDNPLSSRGTLLNESGAAGGKTEAPADLWRQKDGDVRTGQGAAERNDLFQSNKKEKRVEDFYKGVNKAVEVEQADDRYHKPTKPQ